MDSAYTRAFCREYDLKQARREPCKKEPASHQSKALDALAKWYESKPLPDAGGILVLPTGAGKTFTASRFLCRAPLSEGYRVLWLANTHHLLEQAFYGLEACVGKIAEPNDRLSVRVVSGVPGHFRISDIAPADNVVIATLQTICHGYKEHHPALETFFDAAKGKLFVVFDEAHHSPAPSYRDFIFQLRKRFSDMYLLGLTATPTYTNENKRGLLARVFPQGIVYQVAPQSLMAAGILAEPIIKEERTRFTPEFDEREYQKWVGTYGDLPEDIITQLAQSRERNQFIADCYVNNKEKYGKTIIFADRWFQCEQIGEFLRNRGVKTGSVYSRIDANPGSVEARNSRTADDNAKTLSAFRGGKLDVLLNVRMLTEGTDVPELRTVFLTRATTSQILLTQMVGRALRGPKFGGTPEAHIVSFIDNWRHLINWAEYDPLGEMPADEQAVEYGKRPPVQIISIELVQQLARMMDSGISMTPGPFVSLLPAGWYRIEYQARVQETEDIETVRELVMVFQNELANYQNFLQEIAIRIPDVFASEDASLDDLAAFVEGWQSQFFPQADEHFGSNLCSDLFRLARHVGQNGTLPPFFRFEARELHDLDKIAKQHIDRDLGPRKSDEALMFEYQQSDRLWATLYPTYDQFRSHYDACVNRQLHALRHGADGNDHKPRIVAKEFQAVACEPSAEIKEQVKQRDHFVCLCCGENNKRLLEVDHISPHYLGTNNILDNLQTLCRACNSAKGTTPVNFRDTQTDLTQPPAFFPEVAIPKKADVGEAGFWVGFLCRCFGNFYRCDAVRNVSIGKRGDRFYNWEVGLSAGNNPKWVEPHLQTLFLRICETKSEAGYGTPESIAVLAPDMPTAFYGTFPDVKLPSPVRAADAASWEIYLRQGINKYFGSRVVKSVEVADGRDFLDEWRVSLKKDTDTEWMKPHLPRLLERIRDTLANAGQSKLNALVISADETPEVRYSL